MGYQARNRNRGKYRETHIPKTAERDMVNLFFQVTAKQIYVA